MHVRTAAIALIALTGCKPPPPAPQGLDAASTYMVREFWSDDATFQAGIQGFYNWFEIGDPATGDPPGKELVGLAPGQEGKETDAFTIADLTLDDVAAYPLDEEIILDPNDPNDTSDDEIGPRDISLAAGVVSLAEMDCDWKRARGLLVRPDQNTVFPKDWEGYERTYLNDRATFEGTEEGFDPIDATLEPYAAGFDASAFGKTILLTDNIVDPSALLGVNIPGYPMALEFRQGVWDIDVDGTPTQVHGFAIITYELGAAWGPDGTNGLRQSYSVEINLERPGDKTLRMLAVWAEPVSPIISADSALALNYAVTKSLNSSNLLSEICSGEVEVADEPTE